MIGAGFTGTALAIQLAERLGAAGEVILFDRADAFGKGIAYSTTNERHLLNVPAANMGAYDGDPGHFLRWLEERGYPAEAGSFQPRNLYGVYLRDLLGRHANIQRVSADVRRLDVAEDGVVLRLSRARSTRVDQVVLCIGNFPPVSPAERRMARASYARYVANPWCAEGLAGIGPSDGVVLVGSGLTMVDLVLDLQSRGHQGRITALSRHGLMPMAHRQVPALGTAIDWPLVTPSAMALLRTIRDAARRETEAGGDWRSVIDSMRPHTQALWRKLPLVERRRFMRHLKAYWEVHRHRLAPEVAQEIERMRSEGRFVLMAGRVREVVPGPDGVRVSVRRRSRRSLTTIDAGWIVNCSGPALDYERTGDSLMRALFRRGIARPGPLSLGLDVSDDFRLVDAQGNASSRLFCIGPPIRGVLWETTAVPDIRRQCASVAAALGV